MIENPLALSATAVATVAAGFWLESRFRWARQVGASLLIILIGALWSNLELVPLASPVYDVIFGPVTSLAIVWLLLAVDLRDLRAAGPRMLGAFALAVVATAAGALTAALTVGRAFPGEAWKLAGVMTGTYAGGSLNFVAVGRELDLPPALFTAATAADNVLTALWMGATLLLPLYLHRHYRARRPAAVEESDDSPASARFGEMRTRPFDVAALTTVGLLLIIASEAIRSAWPAVPGVIWLTTLALLVGLLPPVRRLEGALPMGLLALNLFFVVIGIGSRVAEIFRVGPEVFYFTVLVVAVHGVVTYGGAKLLGIDVETTSVASQAAVGGPSTALALAVARGWRDLALPGVVVGLLGYAVGNYAGLLIAAVVRALLGG